MSGRLVLSEPVVVTGVGLIAAVGAHREEVWRAVRRGQSGVHLLRGIDGIPDDQLCGATVDLPLPAPPGRLKAITLTQHAAREALEDAHLDWPALDRERFGCSINAIMGDAHYFKIARGLAPVHDEERMPWWRQWLPNTMCAVIAEEHQLLGPRLCHSTACASSLMSFIGAVRAIRDNQCDIALCGGGDAIDPLFAAGFKQMRALAECDDPVTACKPYDRQRNGFVLGEGAGLFVVERLGHALRRGAKIYAEVSAGRMLAEAHHLTGLDVESETLARLIEMTLAHAGLAPEDIGYINSHGTGTQQNDLVEMRAIRQAFGSSINTVCVSATKSMLGHAINGAGAVELAITLLAMRDGFAPPTMNHTDPDPECAFDCLPQLGRINRFQHGLKISVAFGGHLVAVALSRWDDAKSGFAYRDDLDAESVPARKAA